LQKAFGLAVGFANKDIYVSMVRLVADGVSFERSVPARGCSWFDVDVVGVDLATTWQWS
jgi:hypothetical protein